MVKDKQEMTRAEVEEAKRKHARDKKAAQRAGWRAKHGVEEYNKKRADEQQNWRAKKKKELEECKLAAEMNPSSALFKALENTNKTQLEYATIAQQGTENIFSMGGQFCKDNLSTIASSLPQTSTGPSSCCENRADDNVDVRTTNERREQPEEDSNERREQPEEDSRHIATVTPPAQRTRRVYKRFIKGALTRKERFILTDQNNKHEAVNLAINLFHEAFETYAPGVQPEEYLNDIRHQCRFPKEVWEALAHILKKRNDMIHCKNNGWIYKLDLEEFHHCVQFLLDKLLPRYHLVHYNAEVEQLRREKNNDIEQLRREKNDEIAAYVSWENYKKGKELAQKDKIIAMLSRKIENSKKRGRDDDDDQDDRAAKRRKE